MEENEVEKEWFTKVLFENGQLPAINDDSLNKIQNNINAGINTIINNIFPIGKIEVFFNSSDYSNYMGFTWEKVAEGKMLVGAGTVTDKNNVSKTFSAGNNVGEYEHKQTKQEIAQHIHDNIKIDNVNLKFGVSNAVGGSGITVLSTNLGDDTHSIQTGNVNGLSTQQSMNTTNPTYGVYVWKRIS